MKKQQHHLILILVQRSGNVHLIHYTFVIYGRHDDLVRLSIKAFVKFKSTLTVIKVV